MKPTVSELTTKP